MVYNPKTQTVSSSSPTFLFQFTRPIDDGDIPYIQVMITPPNGNFSNETFVNGSEVFPTAVNGAQLQVNVNFVLPAGNYILFPTDGSLIDKAHQFYLSSLPRTPFTVQ